MKILSFRLWDELFGIDIGCVKEINRSVSYTLAPTSPADVMGLYNMRGQVVTILDLALILGYEPIKRDASVDSIILKQRCGTKEIYGFAIDTAEDVLTIKNELISAMPANVEAPQSELLKGVYQAEHDLILLIDVEKVFLSRGSVS